MSPLKSSAARLAPPRKREHGARASATPVPGTGGNAPAAPPHRHWREILQQQLGEMLGDLFAEMTGLHFHIAWAAADPAAWADGTSPAGCSVCCRLTGSPKPAACQGCGARQLARALASDGDGIRFCCRLGLRNYWLPVRLRGEALGIAYLQASREDLPRPVNPAERTAGGRRPPLAARPQRLGAAAFDRASRLLRFIVCAVQCSSLAELRAEDLAQAGQAVLALEKELARLHTALEGHLPLPPLVVPRPEKETHARQVVQRLREIVAQRYAQPLTLRECARELRMNAAYLSAIFSREAGVSFKTHLTATRLERAKALLSEPTCPPAEVAYAVGYASENRFRAAFKQATGLPPKQWRETLKLRPAPAAQTVG